MQFLKRIAISLLDHIFLFRVPLLAPVWTIFLLGVATGRRVEPIESPSTMESFAAFSFLVGGIYILNQIFDVESDRINKKLFILPQKLVRMKVAWGFAIVSILLPIGYSFSRGPELGIVFLASALLGVIYNCRPFLWKDRARRGLLANMVGHGYLTFAAGWYSCARMHSSFWIPAIAASFAIGAAYLCTTIVDAQGDAAVGKRTFSVRYGEKAAARLATVLLMLTLGLSFKIEAFALALLLSSAIPLPIFFYLCFRPSLFWVFKAFKIPVFILTCATIYDNWWYGGLILFTFVASRLYYRSRFGIRYPTFRSQ